MKKYVTKVTWLLIAIMLLSSIAVSASGFNDGGGHWAERHIDWAADLKWVTGYPDGSFKPNASITNAEFVSLINRVAGLTGDATLEYVDVSEKDWYYNDVKIGVANAYLNNYGAFYPKTPISREEVARIVGIIYNVSADDIELSRFTDREQIKPEARRYVSALVKYGIINGYPQGDFKPASPITRAEAAVVLYKMFAEHADVFKTTAVADGEIKKLPEEKKISAPIISAAAKPPAYAPEIYKPGYQIPETPQIEWKDRMGKYAMSSSLFSVVPADMGEYFMIRWDHAAVWDYQTYDPDAPMTRIEFVYLLAKTLRANRDLTAPLPADINPNGIYANWWQRVAKTNVFQFMLDVQGNFKPNQPMTLAEIVYAIGEYWKYTGAWGKLPGIIASNTWISVDYPELVQKYSSHWSFANLLPVVQANFGGPVIDYDFWTRKMIIANIDKAPSKGDISVIFSDLFGRRAYLEEHDRTVRPAVSVSGKNLAGNDMQVNLLGPQWEVARLFLHNIGESSSTRYQWIGDTPHLYYRDTGVEIIPNPMND